MIEHSVIKGYIEIERFNNGILDGKYKFENLITDNGFKWLIDLYRGVTTGSINKLALGTGSNIASTSDISLQTRILLLDVRYDVTMKNALKFLVTIPENTFPSTTYYREAGLVRKETTNEILITRTVFPTAVYQKPSNSLSISYTLQLA
jgi:hypothetical protein